MAEGDPFRKFLLTKSAQRPGDASCEWAEPNGKPQDSKKKSKNIRKLNSLDCAQSRVAQRASSTVSLSGDLSRRATD